MESSLFYIEFCIEFALAIGPPKSFWLFELKQHMRLLPELVPFPPPMKFFLYGGYPTVLKGAWTTPWVSIIEPP